MKKIFFAVLLALSALPAVAQWPPQGFYQEQNIAPLEVTSSSVLAIESPNVVAHCSTGCGLVLPQCVAGQKFQVFLVPSTNGQALFTASGSGSTLTVSAISNGVISIGTTISGNGIPSGTMITAQTSGAAGGAGTYTTSVATTASAALVLSNVVAVSPAGSDSWLSGGTGAMWLQWPVTSFLAVGGPSGCGWTASY
jgi:hypothetical protein